MLPMDPKDVVTVLCPTDTAFKALNKAVGLTYEEMLAHPSYAKQVCSFCGLFCKLPCVDANSTCRACVSSLY